MDDGVSNISFKPDCNISSKKSRGKGGIYRSEPPRPFNRGGNQQQEATALLPGYANWEKKAEVVGGTKPAGKRSEKKKTGKRECGKRGGAKEKCNLAWRTVKVS